MKQFIRKLKLYIQHCQLQFFYLTTHKDALVLGYSK